MEIITKKAAIAAGMKTYFTGKPCVRGHLAVRPVKGGACTECCKLIRAKWVENNKEKSLEIWREYRLRHIEKFREKDRETHKRTYQHRREQCLIKARQRYANNKDKYAQAARKWVSENREKASSYQRNRRAKKAMAGGVNTASDIQRLLTLQRSKCATCRCTIKPGTFHIDHIVAIANGGTNWPQNLQLLCKTCNLKKGAMHPIDWARRNGFLL